MSKQLYRSRNNKVIGGVCAGIGEYFEIDPTIVRIIWLTSIFAGIGVIAYIIAWIIIPEQPVELNTSSYSYDAQKTKTQNFDSEKSKRILGIALIVIGCIFLFKEFFRWFDFDLLIPVGIIAIGIFILLNARREDK